MSTRDRWYDPDEDHTLSPQERDSLQTEVKAFNETDRGNEPAFGFVFPDLGESAHEFTSWVGQAATPFYDPPSWYDRALDIRPRTPAERARDQKRAQPARPGDTGLRPSANAGKADLGVQVRHTNTDGKGMPMTHRKEKLEVAKLNQHGFPPEDRDVLRKRNIDNDQRPPVYGGSADVQHILVDRRAEQMTPQADRIFRRIVPEALELFARKSKSYELSAGNLAEELGVKGQWGDIYRKVMKLKAPLWEGKPVFTDGQYAEFEDTKEVLQDLLGHVLLALDMLEDK